MTSGIPAADAPALRVALAGGGSAGHVNPLLALADCLVRRDPGTRVTVLGTREGLEHRLVPERGYDLRVLPRAPFPRRPGAAALRFPGAFRAGVAEAARVLRDTAADVLVGFGGYVSTPAYLAARRAGVPVVVHEQNARPGLANRLGAQLTAYVAVTFAATRLRNARVLGMPLRREVTTLDRQARRAEGLAHFGLEQGRTTMLVFGGSLGAQRLNETVAAVAPDLAAAAVQVLHLTGTGKAAAVPAGLGAPYLTREYTDRMDLAYAVADLAVCRAGAGTVCELTALGIPAVYVPLPVGNGEQRLNAADVLGAGGGLVVDNADFTPQWARAHVLPLLADAERLAAMGRAAASVGHRDGDERLADLVLQAAGRPLPRAAEGRP